MVAKFRRNRKRNIKSGIFFSVLFGALLLIIIGFLVFTNIRINNRRTKLISQIEFLEKEIQVVEGKKQEMEAKISQAGSKEFLEKIARDQLDMKKPGEEVVVAKIEENPPTGGSPADKEEKDFWNPQGWWEWIKNKVRD